MSFKVADLSAASLLATQLNSSIESISEKQSKDTYREMVALKDIVPAAQNNINTRFILLDKASMNTSSSQGQNSMNTSSSQGQNKTCLALVADETAAVHFQLWGEECDAFEPGDIIHLSNGIFSYSRNSLLLRAGKRGKIEKVGEFTMAYVETPNMSEIRWAPDPNSSHKYVQEAVISPHSRIFPPKY